MFVNYTFLRKHAIIVGTFAARVVRQRLQSKYAGFAFAQPNDAVWLPLGDERSEHATRCAPAYGNQCCA